MSKKVYCSISNHTLSEDICKDKLNYQTYIKLLEYFDEVHIYGRTFGKKSYMRKDPTSCIYVHYTSVPKSFILKYITTVIKIFLSILKDDKKYCFSILDASEPTTGGVIATLLKVFLKKPFLLQVQGEMTRISPKTDGILQSIGSKYFTLLSTKFADKVRTVSYIIEKQLIEDGVKKVKIEVLPPRVNLKQFDYKKYSNTNNGLKKQFNISENKKLLVFVGRLVVFKGVKYLIEACKYLNKKEYHLLIVGDGTLRGELESLTQELGLEDNITFVGAVEFIRVPYFMAGADLFVLPSLDEGFGRVILESMAVKTLVLASRVGGIQDIIVDNETGFFMEAGNINSILSNIQKILKMEERHIDNIIEKSYKLVHDDYEFNNSMSKFIHIYDNMIVNYENT